MNRVMGLPVEVDYDLDTARILWSDDVWRDPGDVPALTTRTTELLGETFQYTEPVPVRLRVSHGLLRALKERYGDGVL